jgi:hypothetical protein
LLGLLIDRTLAPNVHERGTLTREAGAIHADERGPSPTSQRDLVQAV